MLKVLVVEDEKILNDMMKVLLEKINVKVDQVYCGNDAIELIEKKKYHLIITDLMMTDGDGFEVIKFMKNHGYQIPVIILSALEDDDTKIKAYTEDIFDYISKPINEEIFTKKMEKILGLFYQEIKQVKLIESEQKVLIDGKDIHLTVKEFDLFKLLYSLPGQKFSKYDLINEIWYENMNMSEKIVEVNILNIRKKLGKYSENIKTYRNLGYTYEEN